MKKSVTVILARVPTVEDYKRVGLVSGYHKGYKAEGDEVVNALAPQFNGSLRVEWDDNPDLCDDHSPAINFECGVEGFEGAWYLPADLFTVRDAI